MNMATKWWFIETETYQSTAAWTRNLARQHVLMVMKRVQWWYQDNNSLFSFYLLLLLCQSQEEVKCKWQMDRWRRFCIRRTPFRLLYSSLVSTNLSHCAYEFLHRITPRY
jgi:hypothetical protein